MQTTKTNLLIMHRYIIPGVKLGSKVHTWNDVNGGVKKVPDLGMDMNTFYGGRVEILGLIKEYGFYLCKDYATKEVIGFYVHDGANVTEIGRKLLESRFAGCTLQFEPFIDNGGMSEQEIEERESLREAALRRGYSAVELSRNNATELKALVEAFDAGKPEQKVQIIVEENVGAVVPPDKNIDYEVKAKFSDELIAKAARAKKKLAAEGKTLADLT